MRKNILIYTIIIGTFGCLIWFILEEGKLLEKDSSASTFTEYVSKTFTNKVKPAVIDSSQSVWNQFRENVRHPMGLLLLQLLVILFTARLFGFLFTRLRQPSVVGEIIAGIFLGPSILGLILPGVSSFVFPAESLRVLQFLSQIGLAFFMFIIGMDLDLHKIRNKAQSAIIISHASIVIPFFLGVLLAYFIFKKFAPTGVSFLAFSLFMGIAMSITAFPVLARIIQERKLSHTPIGMMVITCAATNDITAWFILATVIAIVKAGTITSALLTIALAIVYVLMMLYLIRPWLKRLDMKLSGGDNLSKTMIAISFLVLLLSSYIAEIIGIHTLFGAFLAGAIMPQIGRFKSLLTEKIEDVSVLLLLPIFFVFTGLRTQFQLLSEGHLWITCLVVILVAVVGKFAGTTLPAKMVGYSWKDALSIGALMNTRGLMELVVLNIGYDLGILSPEIFAIILLMALVTTFMTGPSLDLIDYIWKKKSVTPG